MEYKEFRQHVEYYEQLIRDHAHDVLMKSEKYSFTLLENLYFRIFKKQLNVTCGNCYYDAIFELRSINEKIYNDMKNLTWKLKAGKVYRMNGRFWSSESKELSNEVCEQLFAMYGKNIFDVIPEKQQVIEKEIPKDEPVVVETTVKENKTTPAQEKKTPEKQTAAKKTTGPGTGTKRTYTRRASK